MIRFPGEIWQELLRQPQQAEKDDIFVSRCLQLSWNLATSGRIDAYPSDLPKPGVSEAMYLCFKFAVKPVRITSPSVQSHNAATVKARIDL